MENLVKVKDAEFNNLICDVYGDNKGDFFMTRKQIGQALEYNDPQNAIDRIHTRHKERLDKFSVTDRLSGTDTKTYDTILYTAKGIYEICRWSQQPKADQFYDFVYDLLEGLRLGFVHIANKKPLDLKAVSIMSKSPKGNMSLVLQALDKMGYDVEGLNVQPSKVVSSDINATINRTIELIDNMIYENIELSQYIAADEENNFICIDFTRLYKEFIRYVRANNIDFDYLNEKDFKKQLKQVDYCITNRYSKKLKLFNSITNEYYKKLVRCVKLDLEKLNDALDLKIL